MMTLFIFLYVGSGIITSTWHVASLKFPGHQKTNTSLVFLFWPYWIFKLLFFTIYDLDTEEDVEKLKANQSVLRWIFIFYICIIAMNFLNIHF